MKKLFASLFCMVSVLSFAQGGREDLVSIPKSWKWIDGKTAAFSFSGTFLDKEDFSVNLRTGKRKPLAGLAGGTSSVDAPVSAASGPGSIPPEISEKLPQGAVNPTFSPDRSKIAYTLGNDLYIYYVAPGTDVRLTRDGSGTILNGYASWVYYEEIFGRPSHYRAFWWSPDSEKIAFYRFDDSEVPVFPIYSPFPGKPGASLESGMALKSGASGMLEGLSAAGGSVRMTRYPKCGEPNPKVRIGFADLAGLAVAPGSQCAGPEIVWADFDCEQDQYFGTPFWKAGGDAFFVSRMPRSQNALDLYTVSPSDGSKKCIYSETSPTWTDWIGGMAFTADGFYMARSSGSGWSQIYFLSYDGSLMRRLTDCDNWRVAIERVDASSGEVFYTAERGSHIRRGLYKVGRSGEVTALTDTSLNVSSVSFSPDGKHFIASLSSWTVPDQLWILPASRKGSKPVKIADMAGPLFRAASHNLPRLVTIKTADSFVLPAAITYPENFDPAKRYPVRMYIYGGPDTPLVRERWRKPSAEDKWCSDNGIIRITADCRAAGHNGRAGLDMVYKRLGEVEAEDFVAWAEYLKSLPYVDGSRIGVEGFSFGGTMTALLVMEHPEHFPYGIAGGGVYDWSLYDTHYTERFMDTPANNPEGYARSAVVNRASKYAASYGAGTGVMLKITHGTGDDNVHYQNMLLLVDALQKNGKEFELMIYPDGMHGYRGRQGEHSREADRAFWLKYLKGE